ncbi:16S rRNA (uracil(1498)-N(3))-methyltransferase [Telmatospirillum siberiense]|uniref:Ribosomal RNA small subunit methyltransferase E n=1 Tax=Telmatospirillum siberiense TaxID=382514 RepID=A0A2N3PTL7_9PROT|nr:16S rRNA (uracil(1498)-N(3))-methyltransferase [Telmatospirillum siberiense]PKU23744.1 16S rRNA (uracil(1498)-N(3))-methyltransferase [Telmatospirillum siberiense]
MDISPKLRLFVEGPLAEGENLDLDQKQIHYLLHVMRLQAGGEVALFNGRDGEWLARAGEVSKRALVMTVERRLRPQAAEPDLWLVFAPVKRARIDFIVEKATELGVSVLAPVFTRHTAMTRVNEERLRAIATEAAEQCERLSVPEVRPSASLDSVLAAWPEGRRLILLDEGGGGAPIASALAGGSIGPAAVLVGPEGGFAKSELDALRALSFATPVGLGPRILRADTAVIAALSCFQALCGDWRAPSTVCSTPPQTLSKG